jgi:hypothetical protein
MMKILLTIVILLSYGMGIAQSTSGVTIIKDTTVRVPSRDWPHYSDEKSLAIILSNGVILNDTSKISIGKGSLPNGDFKYIARFMTTGSQVYETRLKGSTKSKMMEVQSISKKIYSSTDTQYDILCIGGYHIQLASALSSGEVVL